MALKRFYSFFSKEGHFWGLLLFSFVFKIIFLDPSLTYKPQMWAESATNYYYHAVSSSFLSSLTFLDYVYLPLWPRLVAGFIQLFNPEINLIPFLYQGFSLLFICLCTAFIGLKRNRILIQSDVVRLLFGVMLNFQLDYELHTFINFSYWAVIPITFILAWLFLSANSTSADQNSIKEHTYISKNKMIIIASFCVISLLSKALMIGLLPLIIIPLFQPFNIKRFLPIFLTFILAILIQLGIVLTHTEPIPFDENSFDLVKLLYNLFCYTLIHTILPFVNHTTVTINPVNLTGLALISILFFYLLKKTYRKNTQLCYFLVGCWASMSFSILITLKGYQKLFFLDYNSNQILTEMFLSRTWFNSSFLSHLIVLTLLSEFNRNTHFATNKIKSIVIKVLLLCFFTSSAVFSSNNLNKKINFPIINHSLFNKENLLSTYKCIPLNPYPWFLFNNCNYLEEPQNPILFDQIPSEINSDGLIINLSNNFINKRISYIHLIFENINLINNSLLLTAFNSNNDQVLISNFQMTNNLIRWELPDNFKTIKFHIKGISKVSTVKGKPYFIYLGVQQ